MASTTSLVALFRRRIKDERVAVPAFRLSCNDEAATDSLVSLTAANRLQTQVLNGRRAQNLNIDLTDFEYDTVGKLASYLQSQPGYNVIMEQDFVPDHPSRDLRIVGSMSIQDQAVPFRHHIFSDDELLNTLTRATQQHNMSYTPQSLPENEYEFVFMLASSMIQRELANDAAKRRNLELTVEQLLAISESEFSTYKEAVRRQQRTIPSPKFKDEDATGTGDVVQGLAWRRSMRTGFNSPMAGTAPPSNPALEIPEPKDIEDVKVVLRWRRSVDYNFYSYELWRDTVPDVQRPKGYQLITDAPNLQRTNIKQPFTSKLVYRSFGPQRSKDRLQFATFVESAGQLVTEFVDTGADSISGPVDGALTAPALEPEMTYFYRLFVISLNNEISASNVVAVTTLPMRALISTIPPAISPNYGPAGTTVTVRGIRFTGLTTGNPPGSVTLGGKNVLNLTIVNDTTLTFQVPVFYNDNAIVGAMDLVVRSPNTGLIDVYAQAFTYRLA